MILREAISRVFVLLYKMREAWIYEYEGYGWKRDLFKKGYSTAKWALLFFLVATQFNYVFAHYFPSHFQTLQKFRDLVLSKFEPHGIDFNLIKDKVADLLGGITGVAGTFLGLYFTAISIGVGQQFGNLTPRMKQTIVTERLGTTYLKLLTILTAVSFLFWVRAALFQIYSVWAIFLITADAFLLICCFFELSRASFFNAEPGALVQPQFDKLLRIVRRYK